MTRQKINDKAVEYSSCIDFQDDKNLSEKGRSRVREWAKQDFIAGGHYVMKQLILSGVIKSVCLEGYIPKECDQFTALGNCEKCNHFNKQKEIQDNINEEVTLPEHKCKYCGCWTTSDDETCYMAKQKNN